ncbi:roadblock/LC7 domain-containing protein [Streptomyces sp. NPDC006140]|uniref:roadblock/LC7 domain-containing protein n=1 Tax=Streptomyces sp. NPDC006140 TaxID=3154579 RepID=UPI003406EF19
MKPETPTNDLTWLLKDFVERASGAQSALVTSRDGLKVGYYSSLDGAEPDTLSAIASGMHSLAIGATVELQVAGGVRQVTVELDEGYLFVMAAGDGALLTVLADGATDIEQISYETELLIKRMPGSLSVALRDQAAAAGESVL